MGNFNPRPLAGATPAVHADVLCPGISIHAPLRGRPPPGWAEALVIEFQSTPPCGGDQQVWIPSNRRYPISIHAPLRGRPAGMDTVQSAVSDFNPRPLAGATGIILRRWSGVTISIHAPLRGRHGGVLIVYNTDKFQSTPPCGGDNTPVHARFFRHISIHAPLRGRLCYPENSFEDFDFNPRPLAGATTTRVGGGPGD